MTNEELLRIIQNASSTKKTSLLLYSSGITSLPPEIGCLSNLQELYLDKNNISILPAEIGQLSSLKLLEIHTNKIELLPIEISYLVNLETLILAYNKIVTLPSEICKLTNLKSLFLAENQITALPESIGELTNLEILYVSNNRLTTLPKSIGKLTNLQWLYLKDNQLTSLPDTIEQLESLTLLELEGNKLPIPVEILSKTKQPRVIINYYLKLKHSQQGKPLNEVKLLLVGQGGVGKSSLLDLLTKNPYNPDKSKTEGISIQNWQVFIKDESIRLNIWDFGGQEIMHATHQFFLTKRSLYLLVLDARLGEDENRIEYWLKLIQSYGGDSPVIVIGNKIDQHPLDIDQRGLQNKYPNIKKIVAVSCKAQEGLEKLQAAIDLEISELANVQDRLPLSWFEIKTTLEQMEEDYIPYTNYELICKQNQIDDSLSQNTLIELLHQLGIVLSFRDDPRLAEMGVLNPEWVTNGVYKILNDNLLLTEYRGILEYSDLSRILDSHRYPPNKQLFIVDMMRKFELCFPLEDSAKERVLIPDLLSKEEPATGDWENALAFQYHYDVLPHSIISRFIVRIHHLAERRTWWRTGIVLKHQNNRAIIKTDREDKQILILVNSYPSSRRRELLAVIRSEFNAIHQTIKGLEVKEKVPLPNHPKILVDYEHLLNLAEMGIRTFVPEGLKEEVSVNQLLNGIEVKQNRQRRQREGDNEDITMMDRSSTNRPIINNIYNQNAQENRNPMSNIQQNHYGKGDNVAGNKTLNQFNNSTNLAEAVRDIKELLGDLSKDYPNDSQATIGAKAADRIESSPTMKQRVVNALKEVGATAIEEAIDHPAIKFAIAAVKGYMDA